MFDHSSKGKSRPADCMKQFVLWSSRGRCFTPSWAIREVRQLCYVVCEDNNTTIRNFRLLKMIWRKQGQHFWLNHQDHVMSCYLRFAFRFVWRLNLTYLWLLIGWQIWSGADQLIWNYLQPQNTVGPAQIKRMLHCGEITIIMSHENRFNKLEYIIYFMYR